MPAALQRFSVPGRLTPTSWRLPSSLSYDDWLRHGQAMAQMGGAVQWALGDWWIYGEHAYGERIEAVRNGALGGSYTFNTLKDFGLTARGVERSSRNDLFSFNHHRAVTSLTPAQQKRWLERAARGKRDEDGEPHSWSVSRLRQEIKAALPQPQSRQQSQTGHQNEEEETYTDEDYQHQLIALAGGADESASNILQRLRQNPGAASSEIAGQGKGSSGKLVNRY